MSIKEGTTASHDVFIGQLKDLLAFYEKYRGNPALPVPSQYDWDSFLYSWETFYENTEEETREKAKARAASVVRAFSGNGKKVTKKYEGNALEVYVPVTDTINWKFRFDRKQVCRLVNTGETRKVTKKVKVQDAVYEDVEEVEEVTAWECEPILKETE